MQKYVVLWLGIFLFFVAGAVAQTASGNVAESSNPRRDVIDAQIFRTRIVEGCVAQRGGYLLVPRHGRPEELTPRQGEDLNKNVGQLVRVYGPETYAGDDANPDADYTLIAERIETVAQTCPAQWNRKWNGGTRGSKP